MNSQFFHYAVFVEFHGSEGYMQNAGNLFGRMSFGEELQNFALPGCELAEIVFPCMGLLLQFFGNHGRHKRASIKCFPDCQDKFRRCRMLQDKTLNLETVKGIKEERINAEWALAKALEKFRNILLGASDEYLRSRVADLDFVGQRILRHLKGVEQESIWHIQEEVIVVAHDLSPADTAQMNKEVIRAFVTDMGGRTSHTAIVARSLEIPAVVGLESITDRVQTGDMIIVDGVDGLVLVNPVQEVLQDYQSRRSRYRVITEEIEFTGCCGTMCHHDHIHAVDQAARKARRKR